VEIVRKEFDVKGEKEIRKQMLKQQEANLIAAKKHEAAQKAGAPGYPSLDWKDKGQKKAEKFQQKQKPRKARIAKDAVTNYNIENSSHFPMVEKMQALVHQGGGQKVKKNLHDDAKNTDQVVGEEIVPEEQVEKAVPEDKNGKSKEIQIAEEKGTDETSKRNSNEVAKDMEKATLVLPKD